MKSRAEVKVLAASFALLMGLVVPMAAAMVDTTTAIETPAGEPATADASFFVHGAPQPLLLMALGALVVLIPVTRRALRAGETVPTRKR